MSWKIFIISHGPIIDNYYKNDPMFSYEHFVVFNVSDKPISHPKFKIINKTDVKGFIQLGKWYAEGEAIYNIYKNNLHKDCDYIGFIHWDYELLSQNPFIAYNISDTIEKIIKQKEKFISFSTYSFAEDYNQNIMMDINFPNQLVGKGRNCYETIVSDYNEYFNETIEIEYLMTKRINLCSAFLCQISVYDELMEFYCKIVERGNLELFDKNHEHRFQGGMLERYIGCYSHKFSIAELPLYHRFSDSMINKFKKLASIIKKL